MASDRSPNVDEELLTDTRETLQERGPTGLKALVDELQQRDSEVNETDVQKALRILASNNKVVHTKNHRLRATKRRRKRK